MSTSLPDPRDVAYEQALVYAREVRELYRENRATALDLEERRLASERIDRLLAGGPDVVTTVFQPIKDLRTGRTAGVEALSRFLIDPQRTPDLWFAEAEKIERLEELDVHAACRAASYLKEMPGGVYLSLNLSPSTIVSPSFQQVVDAAPPNRIVLEVTEHAPIHDYDALAMALTGFRRLGGRLAVDDAGSGFASLRHILRLEPNIIKLDIELTRGIDVDPARRALARALISFAADIQAAIVAEGVETEDELKALRILGVTYAQGFYLGRPGPLEDRLEPERRARPRSSGG
jgi:EAL domain-containing protein (putative c-di-GMP-specific phosphodiesterase class I)